MYKYEYPFKKRRWILHLLFKGKDISRKKNIECKRYYACLLNVISIPFIKRIHKNPPFDMYVLCVFRFIDTFPSSLIDSNVSLR